MLPLVLHLRIDLVQVVVQILENHVELLGHQEDLLELDDVAVVELPQGFDLPQLYAFVPAGVLLLHFLDRHHLARLDVGRLVDRSESAIPKSLDRFVFLHLCLIINKINSSKSIIESQEPYLSPDLQTSQILSIGCGCH